MKQLIALAAIFLGASGAAHSQTTEAQARSYVLSAFVTGAAPTILSTDIGLSLGLRERLRLPADANRDAIYEALFARTEGKPLRVRAAKADEVPMVAARAGANPLFAVEAGDTSFVVTYDLRRDHVPFAGLIGETASAPAPALTVFPSAVPVAEVAQAAPPGPVAVAAVPAVLRLKPITFDYKSAKLSPQARASLDGELPKMAVARDTKYIVQGYSDRIASSRYNQRLSQRRAEAVRDLRACLAPDRRVIVEIRATAT